jgi:hypothetical protein
MNLVSTDAQAAVNRSGLPEVEVYPVGNIVAEDVKEIITLGDEHTFILRFKDSIKVYRVDFVRK